MDEQARWGFGLRDRAIVRAITGVKALAVRLKQLEDRVKALEGR